MKKLFFLLMTAGGAGSGMAQAQGPGYLTDDLLSRWVIDLNLKGGGVSQDFTTVNSNANFPNGLNLNTGNLTYKNGYSFGGDAQLGFFVGKKRHFGFGAGFMYMRQQGFANLDNYHVEYRANDAAGNIYRQVVTGNNVSENVRSSNMNIPLVLKYKNRFSKHWGFAADAGALINIHMNNAYTSNASFDYEAIYKITQNGEGTSSSYDNTPIPLASDWMITKAEFLKNNPNGNVQDYFNSKRALGYNVGEGLTPATRKGNVNYTEGSVGFIVQPSFDYFLCDNVALNLGAYYMLQPFKNNAQANYHLSEGIGSYSSSLNNVSSSVNQSYGVNVGVRFFIGKKSVPLAITSIDQNPPTQCGLCDGGMAIHGLFPDQPVTINYSLNGVKAKEFAGTVQPDGTVKISNLCAGDYTGIVAKIKRKEAVGKPVAIVDPRIAISKQTSGNPSAQGVFDGSVTFTGLYAGSLATISYSLNGNTQAAFSGIVKPDQSLTINGLGEGKYTGISVAVNTCSTNATDFTLVAPAPPPPPPPPAVQADLFPPILFDFDKSVIHSDSKTELDEAAREMKEDKSKTITVNGYTDNIGTDKYNNALSERRANAVKRRLTKLGVSPRRVKTAGHGSKSPVADNGTAEGRHEDRRAVMKMKD